MAIDIRFVVKVLWAQLVMGLALAAMILLSDVARWLFAKVPGLLSSKKTDPEGANG